MEVVKIFLELFKELLPLFSNLVIYNKGKNDGKDIILNKIKDNMIKNLKEQNEILKELQEIENDVNKLSTDDVYDKL